VPMGPPSLFIQQLPILEYSPIIACTCPFTSPSYQQPFFSFTHLSRQNTNPAFVRVSSVVAHGGRSIFTAEVLTLIGTLELLRVSLCRVLALEGSASEVEKVVCITFVSVLFSSGLQNFMQWA